MFWIPQHSFGKGEQKSQFHKSKYKSMKQIQSRDDSEDEDSAKEVESIEEEEEEEQIAAKKEENVSTEVYPEFHSHISLGASTLGPWKVSYKPFPGGYSFLSAFLFLNALTLGLGDRFEVGTVPLLYFVRSTGHLFNFSVKWNFYKGEVFQAGVGYSFFAFKIHDLDYIQEADGSRTSNPMITYSFVPLILNWFPTGWPVRFGLNINIATLYSNSKLLDDELVKINKRIDIESVLETEFLLSQHWSITQSFTKTRTNSFDVADSPAHFGFGATVHFLRDKDKWFNRVSLGGHYVPAIRQPYLLFSFDI